MINKFTLSLTALFFFFPSKLMSARNTHKKCTSLAKNYVKSLTEKEVEDIVMVDMISYFDKLNPYTFTSSQNNSVKTALFNHIKYYRDQVICKQKGSAQPHLVTKNGGRSYLVFGKDGISIKKLTPVDKKKKFQLSTKKRNRLLKDLEKAYSQYLSQKGQHEAINDLLNQEEDLVAWETKQGKFFLVSELYPTGEDNFANPLYTILWSNMQKGIVYSFKDFMQIALYTKYLGFYNTAKYIFTHFGTSPNADVFYTASNLIRSLKDFKESGKSKFIYIEYGPGEGTHIFTYLFLLSYHAMYHNSVNIDTQFAILLQTLVNPLLRNAFKNEKIKQKFKEKFVFKISQKFKEKYPQCNESEQEIDFLEIIDEVFSKYFTTFIKNYVSSMSSKKCTKLKNILAINKISNQKISLFIPEIYEVFSAEELSIILKKMEIYIIDQGDGPLTKTVLSLIKSLKLEKKVKIITDINTLNCNKDQYFFIVANEIPDVIPADYYSYSKQEKKLLKVGMGCPTTIHPPVYDLKNSINHGVGSNPQCVFIPNSSVPKDQIRFVEKHKYEEYVDMNPTVFFIKDIIIWLQKNKVSFSAYFFDYFVNDYKNTRPFYPRFFYNHHNSSLNKADFVLSLGHNYKMTFDITFNIFAPHIIKALALNNIQLSFISQGTYIRNIFYDYHSDEEDVFQVLFYKNLVAEVAKDYCGNSP